VFLFFDGGGGVYVGVFVVRVGFLAVGAYFAIFGVGFPIIVGDGFPGWILWRRRRSLGRHEFVILIGTRTLRHNIF